MPDEFITWVHSLGVAQAKNAVRIPQQPELGFDYHRVGVPVRSNGLLLGYLWIIDPDGLLANDKIEIAERAAAEIAAIMHRDLGGSSSRVRPHPGAEPGPDHSSRRPLYSRGGGAAGRSDEHVLCDDVQARDDAGQGRPTDGAALFGTQIAVQVVSGWTARDSRWGRARAFDGSDGVRRIVESKRLFLAAIGAAMMGTGVGARTWLRF